MAKSCSVCVHADRAMIDSALVAGEPYRSVAQRHAVSPDATQRHKSNHLARAIAKAARTAEMDREAAAVVVAREAKAITEADMAGQQLDKLVEIEKSMKRLAIKAELDKDYRGAAQCNRELIRICELLLKVAGELPTAPQVQIAVLTSPEWSQLKDKLVRALEPFPEAALAVAEAMAGGVHAGG